MKNINKVDRVMDSVEKAVWATDDGYIIEDSDYIRGLFAPLFHQFLGDIYRLVTDTKSQKIPESEYKRIDELVAEILIKHIQPGKANQRASAEDNIEKL